MKELKVLLLQGGVEVIAEIEPLRSPSILAGTEGPITGYTLYKPFRILPVPITIPRQTPQGVQMEVQITPQMIPLMGATIQSWIEISLSDIVGKPMDAQKQFESAYTQRTTGIQLA